MEPEACRAGCSKEPLVMRRRSPGSSTEPHSGSESRKGKSHEQNPTELPGWTVISTRLGENHPGPIAMSYLTRSTWQAPPDTYSRSTEQDRQSDENFKAWGRRFDERRRERDGGREQGRRGRQPYHQRNTQPVSNVVRWNQREPMGKSRERCPRRTEVSRAPTRSPAKKPGNR